MKTTLKGRVVAITGGARGSGPATGKVFAAAGAKVAIGDLDADRAKQAMDQATRDAYHARATGDGDRA